MASKLALKIIPQTGELNSGTVVFLHGSGDTGRGVYEWISHLIPDFAFPHLKIILPTAPARPYTPFQGAMSNVWFDRSAISKLVPEDLESIDHMAKEIVDLVTSEVKNGIPLERIIVGGFSMGGALSFHIGYRHLLQLGGVFGLSAFLNDGSSVFDHLQNYRESKPPLFQWHGQRDDLVPLEWGEGTFNTLKQLGVQGVFHTNKNALHELKKESLVKLKDWILEKVPEL